jgi:hypothetical protein
MRALLGFATRLYLVLTVLAGLPAGAGRSVLCVAPNGHLAIEVGEGRCADYASSASDEIENAEGCTAPDGCGDCADLPIGKQVFSAAHHDMAAARSALLASPIPAADAGAELLAGVSRTALIQSTPTHTSFPPSRTTIFRN